MTLDNLTLINVSSVQSSVDVPKVQCQATDIVHKKLRSFILYLTSSPHIN